MLMLTLLTGLANTLLTLFAHNLQVFSHHFEKQRHEPLKLLATVGLAGTDFF